MNGNENINIGQTNGIKKITDIGKNGNNNIDSDSEIDEVYIKNDGIIATEIIQNQNDINNLTEGNINQNEFVTQK